MKPRYFWLYSDGKTVKEISWEEWRDIIKKDREAFKRNRYANSHLLCRTEKAGVYVRKGEHYNWIPRSQLEKVLKENEK